jgi:hypothetical protein
LEQRSLAATLTISERQISHRLGNGQFAGTAWTTL